MEGENKIFWIRWLCLRCLGEFITRQTPQVCPFCLAGMSLLADRYQLSHQEPGASSECPGVNLQH